MNTKRTIIWAGKAVAALALIALVVTVASHDVHRTDPWTSKKVGGPPVIPVLSFAAMALNALVFNRATFIIALLMALPMLAWTLMVVVLAGSPDISLHARSWLMAAVCPAWLAYVAAHALQPR